jgi:hypothetical protein
MTGIQTMKMVRSVTAAALAATMLATSAAPAMAQGYPGGYPGGGYGNSWGGGGYGNDGYRHRRHNRIGAGDVIAGVAILGVLAAIASSGSKRRGSDDRYGDRYRGGINNENAAADACAQAAEQRGGQVTGVDNVRRTSDGYSVRGTLSSRGGTDRYGQQRFACEVRYGAVESVRIDGDNYGSRGW